MAASRLLASGATQLLGLILLVVGAHAGTDRSDAFVNYSETEGSCSDRLPDCRKLAVRALSAANSRSLPCRTFGGLALLRG